MTKMLNWQKRSFDFRPKTNIKDENEFRKGDMAARWLERAEQRLAERSNQKRKSKHNHKRRQRRPAKPVQPVMRPRPAGPDEKPPWED